MKKVLFLVLMFAVTLNILAQEGAMLLIANPNVLAGDAASDYSVSSLKMLQQSEVDGALFDARVAANEDFLASASVSLKSCFFKIDRMEDVDLMLSAVTRFFNFSQARFVSSDWAVCKNVLRREPRAQVVYAGDDRDPKELSNSGVIGVQYSLPLLREQPGLVNEAHASKLVVLTNMGGELKTVVDMADLHLDYVFTDDPYLLNSLLQGKSLLKVMSFNIRMSGMSDFDGDNRWDNRKEAVVRMLNEQAPDLLGVQEMLPAQKDYLVQSLKQYNMVGVGRDDGENEGEYMSVFYNPNRFELLDKYTYWLSETPDQVSQGWDAACKRTVTVVKLKDLQSGREICYMNTHLDHVGEKARAESVSLLMTLAAKVASDGAVVVMGGDMNTEPQDPIFEPLVANGFFSARATALQTDQIKSYNAYGKGTPSCIDQLYYKETKALKFVTLTKDYGVPYISDHYPVIGYFEL